MKGCKLSRSDPWVKAKLLHNPTLSSASLSCSFKSTSMAARQLFVDELRTADPLGGSGGSEC